MLHSSFLHKSLATTGGYMNKQQHEYHGRSKLKSVSKAKPVTPFH